MRQRGNETCLRFILPSMATVLTAILLAGCWGPTEASPSPTPTSSPTPSVGQTPSPEAPDVAQGIASTCDELLANPSLSAVTGSAVATEPKTLWSTAAEVAGGLLCGFETDELSGTIVALPADRAESLAVTEAECAPFYDAVECIGTGSSDEFTVAVSFLTVTQTQAEVDTVARLRDAAVDAVRVAARTPLAEPPAVPPSCNDLADLIDPSAVLRADEVFPVPIMEGDFPFDRRVVEGADLVRACDWSELTDFRELQVVIVPGGADRWDEVTDRFGGTVSPIDGADATESQGDHGLRILVRGSEDLLLVEGRFGEPGDAQSMDDMRTVARQLLALS